MRETQCPRCGREVDLPLGELCTTCRARIRGRARRVARRTALGAVAAYALWVFWRIPRDPTVRMVTGGAALLVWALVYTITFRAARAWFTERS